MKACVRAASGTYLDGVNIEQQVAGPVTDQHNWVGEGHCGWNRSEHGTFVQSTGRYYTHLYTSTVTQHCHSHARHIHSVLFCFHSPPTRAPYLFITGPPNGPVLFCTPTSDVCRLQRCRRAGRPAAGRMGDRAADTARRASTVTSR